MNLEDSGSDKELSEEKRLMAGGDRMDEEEDESDSRPSGRERSIEKISELQHRQPCNSLKKRQLELIVSGVKRATKEIENEAQRARERILDETRQQWISIGMIRQEDAHLLETVEGPYRPLLSCQGRITSPKRKSKSKRCWKRRRLNTTKINGYGKRRRSFDS